MVKLKRLKINKYRNVRPGTELRFDDGVNIVLGQNGSGKTTLLGLLSKVVSHDLSSLREEAFSIEYELVHMRDTLSVSIESPGPTDLPDNTPVPQRGEIKYNYLVRWSNDTTNTIEIEGTTRDTCVRFSNGEPHTIAPKSPFEYAFILSSIGDLDDPRISETWKDIVEFFNGTVARFDESLACFHAITGHSYSALAAPGITKVRVGRVGKNRVTERFVQFAPFGLGKALFETLDRQGGEIHLDLKSEDSTPPALNFLISAARTMGALEATCRPATKTISENATKNNITLEIQGLAFTFKRANGLTLGHEFLSYGQKRLLAFHYYIAATPNLVIADELVNGLHHKWIAACMEAIGDRQAFLTSQNPLLFDYVPEFKSAEQVQSRFITCTTETVDGVEQLVWQNMPADHAKIFFEAYKDDLEQIGEILIARGLW